jgi:uncharacterized protein DUF6677
LNETPVPEIIVPVDQAAPEASAMPVTVPAKSRSRRARFSFAGLGVAILAWAVPGLGHLVLGRWRRALAFLVSVGGLAVAGYLLRGNVFPEHSTDAFGRMGFFADAGTGIFYYFAKFFERAGPDVSRAAGDEGTRFIAAAGLVNLLSAFDAYEITAGRRR